MGRQEQRMMQVASAIMVLALVQVTVQANYYAAPNVHTACFGSDPNQFPANMHVAAAADNSSSIANIWNNGKSCGRNLKIQCLGNGCRTSNAITVKIVDVCPTCEGRVLDLYPEAFAAIADPDFGVITVKYSLASSQDNAEDLPWAQQELIGEVGQIS